QEPNGRRIVGAVEAGVAQDVQDRAEGTLIGDRVGRHGTHTDRADERRLHRLGFGVRLTVGRTVTRSHQVDTLGGVQLDEVTDKLSEIGLGLRTVVQTGIDTYAPRNARRVE